MPGASDSPTPNRTRPTRLHAPHGADHLEITWADGHRQRFSNRLLRGYCPCAGCQGHGGTISFVEPANTELRDVEQVGNYALSFRWGDGHATGIYAFRFLRALGELIDAQGEAGVEALGTLPRL
jgi:DUF971 family protein